MDDQDFERLSAFRWEARWSHRDVYYAARYGRKGIDPVSTVLMHHEIIGRPPRGMVTDHINDNGMDNRRENLRHITPAENRRRSRLNVNNKTGYRGVHQTKGGRFHALIQFEWHFYHLGTFDTKLEAAAAYSTAARLLYGEFSAANRPTVGTVSSGD